MFKTDYKDATERIKLNNVRPRLYARLADCLLNVNRWRAQGNEKWAIEYEREVGVIRRQLMRMRGKSVSKMPQKINMMIALNLPSDLYETPKRAA